VPTKSVLPDAGYATAVTTRHGVLHAGHAGFLHARRAFRSTVATRAVANIRPCFGRDEPLANAGQMVVGTS